MDSSVFVVDDDEAIRTSLTFLLRTEGLRSRAFDSAEALLAELQPDHQGCIITDVRMPGMDGMTLVDRLKAMGCPMPVIVITGHADVPLAISAMRAGVAEFIEKPFEADELMAGVRKALEQARTDSERHARYRNVVERLSALTEREREVFDNITEGLSNKQAAQALGISPRTVEIHRANLMLKLKAESLSELVRMQIASQAD